MTLMRVILPADSYSAAIEYLGFSGESQGHGNHGFTLLIEESICGLGDSTLFTVEINRIPCTQIFQLAYHFV
jgi:hypothetical protein